MRVSKKEMDMRYLFLVLSFVFIPMTAQAEFHGKTVEYKQGDTVLEGYLVYKQNRQSKETMLPGIILVHDWMGLGDYAKQRADMLAELGYVVLAVDIYGKGVRPKNQDEAAKQAGIYKSDRTLMRDRAKAGLDFLKNNGNADPQRIAAIGYCFGGTVALEMARAGMPLKGVVSFHGGLATDKPAQKGTPTPKILVLHGADDPFESKQEITDFQKELNDAGADWQMVYYSGAVHSFTRPDAGNDNSKGAAYNEQADKRSWEAMKQFFNEIFKPINNK
jgi:dienelactone hydrolase